MKTTAMLSLALFLLVNMTVSAQRPKPKETEILGHTMYTVLKPGDIPAMFDPQFISIAEAESLYFDDEPLIVVASSDGNARGYSTWHLDKHEIVNDYIDGSIITVTW